MGRAKTDGRWPVDFISKRVFVGEKLPEPRYDEH